MNLFNEVLAYLNQGGFVMIPLALGCFVMWWAIGYRWYMMGGVATHHAVDKLSTKGKTPEIIKEAIKEMQEALDTQKDLDKPLVEGLLFPFRERLSSYDAVLAAMVTIAPLLGLLGTVIGMIDTFDTLGSPAIGGQSIGISAGVSKALFTTQMGLVVAVPGILFKRILKRKQYVLECRLDEIQEHVLHHTMNEVQ